MKATDILKHEHRVIERVLAVLERAAKRLEAGENVPPEVFEKSLDFIRNFADRCHHAKEEGVLFAAMERKGFPREGGPIAVMLHEHDQGRGYVRGMAQAVPGYQTNPEARKVLIYNALGYTQLLAQHIMKEDNVLYPMADQMLSAAEQKRLTAQYEEVEERAVGPGIHEKLLALANELERAVA